MSTANPQLAPPLGWEPLCLGLCASAALASVLRLLPAEYLADWPPWLLEWLPDDLVLVGQTLWLGLLLALLVVAWVLWRRSCEVRGLQRTQQGNWASQSWSLAYQQVAGGDHLEKARRQMERSLNGRWRPFYLLCLLPAILGLAAGQRYQFAAEGQLLPYLDYYLPLLAGVVEGFLALMLVFQLRRATSRLLQRWTAQVRVLEGHPGSSLIISGPSQDALPMQSTLLTSRQRTNPPSEPSSGS